MPTLDWIGKQAVVNHHLEVPYCLLKSDNTLSAGDHEAGNLLVQGDNLLALKALLPYYAGQVKCIYIDPPYNTGNEGWVYNDNVNSPEIKSWLNKTVGGEDLSRHDKWLCMMYPRLELLRTLLRDDGLIFISIDDNEAFTLKLLMDDIFGSRNFVQGIVWKNKYGPGAMTKGFGNIHEYILCYSRNPIISIEATLTDEEAAKYKGRDSMYELRGGFVTQPLATRSKDDRPNLVYPVKFKGETIWPDKQWIWSKERMQKALDNDEVVIRKAKGKWSVRFKQYLRDEQGHLRMAKPISIMTGPFNQDGTWEIESIFGTKIFPNPKPLNLIKYFCSMVVNGKKEISGLFLDSFAGSGTLGNAILQLNKEDGGDRRFILVEMEENIAHNVTAERLKRVVIGYRSNEGLGGGFRFVKLEEPLFDEYGNIREDVKFNDLAHHIFFYETGLPLLKNTKKGTPLIGVHNGTAYYLLFNGVLGDKTVNGGNILTSKILTELPPHDGPKVLYGEGTRLSIGRLRKEQITFKQLPYEIRVS
ncbi:MAG: site-specific DNA-methyltransferase [bacterium]